jgi:hypothetical protein
MAGGWSMLVGKNSGYINRHSLLSILWLEESLHCHITITLQWLLKIRRIVLVEKEWAVLGIRLYNAATIVISIVILCCLWLPYYHISSSHLTETILRIRVLVIVNGISLCGGIYGAYSFSKMLASFTGSLCYYYLFFLAYCKD